MDEELTNRIKIRYEEVLEKVEISARSVSRFSDQIKLVVVTKAQPIEVVQAVINSGVKDIGENYAEEAASKIVQFKDMGISWHMIGHIQSRKARLVCERFDIVHSLDSLKLARKLNRGMDEKNLKLPVLLECNVSGEKTKNGYPIWDADNLNQIEGEIEELISLPNLSIRGLMTIPPWNPDPEKSRKHYKRLTEFQNHLANKFPHSFWDDLSMGMSNDFEVAIQEGATIIRVGTAIVGPRV